MDKTPKISVIIATKDRFQDIIKCIESIEVQTLLPDEIVIVDASDKQELNEAIKHQFSGSVKIIYIHSKPGLTYQRNVGIGASCGDIVSFLDDDVILDKDFIKEIVNVFENDKGKSIGGVCGDIVNPRSKNDSIGYSILGALYTALTTAIATIFFLYKRSSNGRFRLSGFPTYAYGTDKMVNVECIPGGLTAYRREVLNEFKFDENLHGYCWGEDDDFSFRVSRKYINVYTPYAKVEHKSSPVAKDRRYARMKMVIENHYYLFKKNLPQTFKHRFAFWWSVAGLFVMEILGGMVQKDKEGLKGLKDGLISIRKKKRAFNL
jgi:GT2 family glycosyltransferase